MKSSASESKPFQSRSKGETLDRARRKVRLSRSKLKQAFLIDLGAARLAEVRAKTIGETDGCEGRITSLKTGRHACRDEGQGS